MRSKLAKPVVCRESDGPTPWFARLFFLAIMAFVSAAFPSLISPVYLDTQVCKAVITGQVAERCGAALAFLKNEGASWAPRPSVKKHLHVHPPIRVHGPAVDTAMVADAILVTGVEAASEAGEGEVGMHGAVKNSTPMDGLQQEFVVHDSGGPVLGPRPGLDHERA